MQCDRYLLIDIVKYIGRVMCARYAVRALFALKISANFFSGNVPAIFAYHSTVGNSSGIRHCRELFVFAGSVDECDV